MSQSDRLLVYEQTPSAVAPEVIALRGSGKRGTEASRFVKRYYIIT